MKDSVKKNNNMVTEWEKIFAKDTSGKEKGSKWSLSSDTWVLQASFFVHFLHPFLHWKGDLTDAHLTDEETEDQRNQ